MDKIVPIRPRGKKTPRIRECDRALTMLLEGRRILDAVVESGQAKNSSPADAWQCLDRAISALTDAIGLLTCHDETGI
jgi:hypothetical protein